MALLQMLSSVVPFLHEQAAAAFAAQYAEAEEAQGPQDAPAQEAAPHTYADAIAAWAQGRARPARAQHAGGPRDNLLPEILETLVLTVTATLVDVTRMLAPVPETKGLRQRCAALFQELCAGGDERFARSGVEPLLRAAGLCGQGWMHTVCEVNRTFWVHAGKRDKPLLLFRYLAQPRCRRGASCPRLLARTFRKPRGSWPPAPRPRSWRVPGRRCRRCWPACSPVRAPALRTTCCCGWRRAGRRRGRCRTCTR